MAYTYDPIFAADPSNAANVAANASIILFDPTDAGKAPITITDVTGAALPNPITVNKNGFGPAFQHATLDRVGWFGAGFTGYFTSYEGMKAVALEAAADAQAAAGTAGTEAAAVATAAIGTATDASTAAAASAATAASNASASATAAANAAALVGAPADAAITAAINNGASATRGALNATILNQVGPVSAKVNGRAKAADGIFAAVSESLRSGRSACLQIQGDSTGNADYEWVRLTTNWLGTQHPTAHVKYKVWNDTTQAYDAWTTVQAGAAGERHAVFVPTNARSHYIPQTAIPHIAGDIDIRARVSLDNWAAGATQTLVARYGAAGFHAWKMEITTGNLLNFAWSADGTTDVTKVSSTAPAFTAGQEGWVRCTLDVDNGAGGSTWKGYTSTDGVTWTEIGSSVGTTGGATSIFDAAQEYEIGARGQTGGNIEGKIFEVQIRDGIGGKIVSPQPIDAWSPRPLSGSFVPGSFGGSPTLYVLNGSMPGAAYTYFSDATRHPKMVHPYAGSLAFQSCSHNDADNTGAAYLASRKTWLDLTDARAPGSQVVLVTQNPEQAPISSHSIANHARRRNLLMAWGARQGLAVIDTYKAFQDSPGGLTPLLESDGIHPNTVGSQLWADQVTAAFTA